MTTSAAVGTVVVEAVPAPRRVGAAPTTDDVHAAIRLGWFLAEVRGRHWWQGQRPPVSPVPVDPPFALPLRPERTAAESRGAARDAVGELAVELGVERRFREGDPADPTFPERLQTLAGSLEADGGSLLERPLGADEPTEAELLSRQAAWAEVAPLLHEWDSAIQDSLAARADMLANGYLLGRGLAECYWALGPDEGAPNAPPSSVAWTFLFGARRRSELGRMVGRVAPHLPPMTATAVDASLQVWGEVAADPAWRGADGRAKLFDQYRQWYELIILGRDPTTYVRPYAILRGWKTTARAFRAFWPQLLLAALSAAAVAAVAYFLGTNRGTALLTTALGLFGALGLTAAGVVARAKSAGQQLLARLRQDVYSDLVSVAVTVVPPIPGVPTGRRGARATERRLRAAVRQRRVTPITPMTD
jgi:hypothetical protein